MRSPILDSIDTDAHQNGDDGKDAEADHNVCKDDLRAIADVNHKILVFR